MIERFHELSICCCGTIDGQFGGISRHLGSRLGCAVRRKSILNRWNKPL
jgi:hypothetical protein